MLVYTKDAHSILFVLITEIQNHYKEVGTTNISNSINGHNPVENKLGASVEMGK